MLTCDEKIKVLSSQNVLLVIFLEIRYLIWRYAELNRLLVGSGQIPLNIELKQDDYTVCCIHSVVICRVIILKQKRAGYNRGALGDRKKRVPISRGKQKLPIGTLCPRPPSRFSSGKPSAAKTRGQPWVCPRKSLGALTLPHSRGRYTFQTVKVDPIIEQIPMGGYIISTFA